MKKLLFLLAILMTLGWSQLVNAQTDISIIGGIYNSGTKSEMFSDGMLQLDPINSFSAGIVATHGLDDLFSFRTGLNYHKRGFSFREGTTTSVFGMDIPIGVKVKNEINYIELPALIQADIPLNNNLIAYLAAGPSLAYAMNGKIKASASSIVDFNIYSTELDLSSNNYNRMDISANIIGGIKIPYNGSHFLAEIGYGQALNNFVSEDFMVDVGSKHYGWNFSVGYGMRF